MNESSFRGRGGGAALCLNRQQPKVKKDAQHESSVIGALTALLLTLRGWYAPLEDRL